MRAKRVSISDIAKAAGVSKALVSFALSDKARDYRVSPDTAARIRRIAREMGFVRNNVAASLRTGKTHTIGVIITDISNRFFADIARSIENNATTAGYTVIFGSSDDNPTTLSQLVSSFANRGVDGLVLVPCDGAEDAVRQAVDTGIPVILMDRTYSDMNISSVTLDNIKASAIAVQTLVGNGYTRIALVSYKTTTSNILDREEGYRGAMLSAGLADNVKIYRTDSHQNMDQVAQIVRTAVSDGVQALIFVTNRMSIVGLREMNHLGIKVPDDMAIFAFDGSETLAFELFYTGISYIRQPIDDFGWNVCSLMFSMIDSPAPEVRHIVLEPNVVLKESSKKQN